MCRFNFSTVAADANGERRTGSHGGGGRVNFDFFDDFDPETIAKEAARMSMLKSVPSIVGGTTDSCTESGLGGILLHEAVGHGLEADFIIKNITLLKSAWGKGCI